MLPILRMALRNVLKNWRHSFAAMLTISAGFIAFTIFEGYIANLTVLYEEGFSNRMMLGDVIIEKNGASAADHEDPWKYMLSESDQAVVDEILAKEASSVTNRVRFLDVAGLVGNGIASSVFRGFGYDLKEGAIMAGPVWASKMMAGVPLQDAGAHGLVLGSALGHSLDCAASRDGKKTPNGVPEVECQRPRLQLSATTETGQLNAIEPKIAGLLDAGLKELDARYIALPLERAQELMGTKKLTMVTVKLKDRRDIPDFVARVRNAAAARGVSLEVLPWQEHKLGDLFVRTMEFLNVFRNFVISVIVTIAAMSVLNAIVKAVSERTREIGTLRSLGFLRNHILALFTMEAGILALLSIGIGLIASIGMTTLLNGCALTYRAGLLAEPIPLRVDFVPTSWFTATIILGGVAIGAAFLPARRASRIPITDALGHV